MKRILSGILAGLLACLLLVPASAANKQEACTPIGIFTYSSKGQTLTASKQQNPLSFFTRDFNKQDPYPISCQLDDSWDMYYDVTTYKCDSVTYRWETAGSIGKYLRVYARNVSFSVPDTYTSDGTKVWSYSGEISYEIPNPAKYRPYYETKVTYTYADTPRLRITSCNYSQGDIPKFSRGKAELVKYQQAGNTTVQAAETYVYETLENYPKPAYSCFTPRYVNVTLPDTGLIWPHQLQTSYDGTYPKTVWGGGRQGLETNFGIYNPNEIEHETKHYTLATDTTGEYTRLSWKIAPKTIKTYELKTMQEFPVSEVVLANCTNTKTITGAGVLAVPVTINGGNYSGAPALQLIVPIDLIQNIQGSFLSI